ncbi:MAG: hypothetical protein A2136_00315 [Chloroflexi bacterium RBG_16_54_11]|nr:MAG: hypothetical protein A2136_00315 [Chloroflexi bacterium RBG_16_54_11]
MKKQREGGGMRRWLYVAGGLACLLVILGAWFVSRAIAQETGEAPEAQKVLDVQANMPFQVLIPAYLPRQFDRAAMEIDVNQSGPGGEPMVQLTYRTNDDETLFIREWVPVNPEKEILSGSRPIVTKWGQGWLLTTTGPLRAIWVDVGPLRASIYSTAEQVLSLENLLAVAEAMGPASNRQVFSFVVDPPEVRAVEPPPPVKATINAEGIQEVDLVVTPGGYSPLRFSVKEGIPVKLTFRQLGRVGCGNEVNLPYSPENSLSLRLDDPSDKAIGEFTPTMAGEYQFYCPHFMYRGIMTVREN